MLPFVALVGAWAPQLGDLVLLPYINHHGSFAFLSVDEFSANDCAVVPLQL